jgi:ketosteroid isomerase-like protein
MNTQKEHSNISLVRRFAESMTRDFRGAEELVSEDFVWHYFNRRVPDLEGEYSGLSGVKAFFAKLRKLTENTFQIEPLSAVPFGDEFVVTHANLKLTMESMKIETNAIVVWRLIASLKHGIYPRCLHCLNRNPSGLAKLRSIALASRMPPHGGPLVRPYGSGVMHEEL